VRLFKMARKLFEAARECEELMLKSITNPWRYVDRNPGRAANLISYPVRSSSLEVTEL